MLYTNPEENAEVKAEWHVEELENIEREALEAFYGASEEQDKNDLLKYRNINGALLGAAPAVNVLAWNRVLGIGINSPAREADIDTIVDTYTRWNIPRSFIQVSPAARPAALFDWLHQHGLRHYNNWVKLYRGNEPPPAVETSVRIERIKRSDAEVFADIVVNAFEWPIELVEPFAASVERPGWIHYVARLNENPVATAALFTRDEYAWLAFAATRPAYRGLGAQCALIRARILDALDLGCSHMVMETAEDRPGHPSPSFRNASRMGFRIAYPRPNYLLTVDPAQNTSPHLDE